MAENNLNEPEPTAVDDVRRVRESIAQQHRGNLREHIEETERLFRELNSKLKLKVVAPPTAARLGK
jgi:hypothetical protein